MRVAILRRESKFSFSMDVYADGITNGLRKVRPDWEILECIPKIPHNSANALTNGLQKYYHRYWHYPRSLRHYQVDVFHIIDHSDAHLVYWLKKLGQPQIVTCHDLINLVRPETFRGKALFPLISMATWKLAISGMEQSDGIIAVSQHTAHDIIEHLNPKSSEISVIPNAVDPKFRCLDLAEMTAFRRQYNLASNCFYLLNVGSNNSRKNVFTILKVLLKLREQGLNVHFWKVGTGFDSEQKAFVQTHNLEKYITYWGEPDDAVLIKLYNAADVLLAPSLYEGFGMTILEAMACGTPVVTSNVSSLPEVAGDAAILTEPTDIISMVANLSRLQNDSAFRQSLIEKGLARVKQFSWELTAEKVAQVYENLCLSH